MTVHLSGARIPLADEPVGTYVYERQLVETDDTPPEPGAVGRVVAEFDDPWARKLRQPGQVAVDWFDTDGSWGYYDPDDLLVMSGEQYEQRRHRGV